MSSNFKKYDSIFEDLLDDFQPEEQSTIKQMVDDAELNDAAPKEYQHSISIKASSRALNGSISTLKNTVSLHHKVATYKKFLDRILVPYAESMRFIEDYELGWLYSEGTDKTFYPLDKTEELFTDEELFPRGSSLDFRMNFNTYENLTLKQIIRILIQIQDIRKILRKLDYFVSVSEYVIIDDWIGSDEYRYTDQLTAMLKQREYFKMKDLRAMKHFINVFSRQKSVKREFDETFTKADESYLGTTHSKREYAQIFRQHTDFCPEKLKVERNEEHRNYTAAPPELIITVLSGQEVEVTYHYSMPPVIFRVDGTMKIFNAFSKTNIYSRNE